MYGVVLTGKDSYVVGKQQLAFDVKKFRSKIEGRLIRIFLRYIGLWIEHLDLLSSQILELRDPVSRTVKSMWFNIQLRI